MWNDGHHCCTDDPNVHLTFEIVLTETTRTIDLVYGTMMGARSSTVGVENQTGSAAVSGCPGGTVYSCVPASNTSVRFVPIP